LNGTTGYDILLQETDPNLVDFEMDIYWIVRANKDPLKYFSDYPSRFTMWHIKDMLKSDKTLNTEIGNGLIDFKPLFKKAKLAGLKYPLVEQENFEINPFESINRSALRMKKLF
jgi:sugar phosphate isomerase/epimerase